MPGNVCSTVAGPEAPSKVYQRKRSTPEFEPMPCTLGVQFEIMSAFSPQWTRSYANLWWWNNHGCYYPFFSPQLHPQSGLISINRVYWYHHIFRNLGSCSTVVVLKSTGLGYPKIFPAQPFPLMRRWFAGRPFAPFSREYRWGDPAARGWWVLNSPKWRRLRITLWLYGKPPCSMGKKR